MKLIFCITAALLSFAALTLLAIRGERFGKKRAYLMVLCSALFFTTAFAGSGTFFAEVWRSGGPFAAEITPNVQLFTLPLTGTGEMMLNVKNRGSLTWDSSDENEPVLLSWHLLSETGTLIRFDNPRVPFLSTIPPGDSESVIIRISPSSEGIPAGQYIIEFDLVCENVAWFADRGSATCRVPMEVLP